MRSSIRGSFEHDLIKRCSECKSICLKSGFSKHETRSDGLYPHCKSCRKQNYDENRIKILNQKNYDFENRERKRILIEKP